MLMILLIILLLPALFIVCFAALYLQFRAERKAREQAAEAALEAQKRQARELSEKFALIGWRCWSNLGILTDADVLRMERGFHSTRMRLMGCNHSSRCIYVHGEKLDAYRIDDSGCFCPDFDERRMPCKHIYFLLHTLIGEAPYQDIVHMRKLFSSMPGWDQWEPDIHRTPEQFVRLRLSMLDDGLSVLCYDAKFKIAKVLDMHYANKGQLYLTSCRRCGCEDFRERKLPCKHMYTLASALEGNVERPILDRDHPPLHGIKFTLAGHFPKKSKAYIGVREELAALTGDEETELPYYDASAILLGENPSEGRQTMIEESGLEVFTLEDARTLFQSCEATSPIQAQQYSK